MSRAAIGWVYFMRVRRIRAIKIGWSASVPDRMVSLGGALRSRIEFLGAKVGTLKDEAQAHARFDHLRLRGKRELFHYSDEIDEYVAEACSSSVPPRFGCMFTLSVTPELKKALQICAKACDRTVSGYVKHVLKRGLIEDASRGGRTLPKSFYEKLGGAS